MKQAWYARQAAYWGFKWAGYAFNPCSHGTNPQMAECARLAAHFAIAASAYVCTCCCHEQDDRCMECCGG